MTQAPQLGDPTLDADHEILAGLIEQLAAASDDTVLPALEALITHASHHFGIEDEEIRMSKDGNANCHLDEHAAVLKSLRDVREMIARGLEAPRSKLLISRLSAELRRWLPEHVLGMDAAVATARSKKRLGGAPIVLTRQRRSP